jgi:hypothetical protein
MGLEAGHLRDYMAGGGFGGPTGNKGGGESGVTAVISRQEPRGIGVCDGGRLSLGGVRTKGGRRCGENEAGRG